MQDETTGASIHANLGMFVLAYSGHGDYGTITCDDDIEVKLVDVYRMLSPKNFPAMKGKPKMVILDCCSGGEFRSLLSLSLPTKEKSLMKW